MLVGIVSAKGSPGVTTAALALAATWPRTALVIEADPFGGDVRAGLGRGEWPPAAGLHEAVADLRTMGIDEALRHRVHRPAAWAPPVLAGLGRVGQASAVPWERVGAELGRLGGADVLADCGRFLSADGVAGLLRSCHVLVLVTRSSLRAVRAAARTAPVLADEMGVPPGRPRLPLMVIAPGDPYPAAEIAQACGIPLLGELPDDPRAAGVWSDGDPRWRGFDRSMLQREARRIAGRLASGASVTAGAA